MRPTMPAGPGAVVDARGVEEVRPIRDEIERRVLGLLEELAPPGR